MWIFQDNLMLQHMVSRNMPPKNCVADFGLQRLSPVNLGVIIIPGRHRSAVQSFPSKQASCTFVATKLRFVLTKVTCRMLAHRRCGYLGENFWNVGKTKEIKSRVLHL